MRANNNETINPSQTRNSIQQIFHGRSKRVKKVTLSKSGQGGASGKHGDVFVPAGETAYDRTVRLHEALHVDFTTKKFNPKDALDQGLEDARLHRYCSQTRTVRSARRDEITVAIKDLRKAIKKSQTETPTAITSLVILRAAAILHGETNYTKLLSTASQLIASDYLGQVTKAINMIEPGTESKNWQRARKLLRKYFVKDFNPQSQSERPDFPEQQSQQQQSSDSDLPDVPQPESAEQPEQSKTKKSKPEQTKPEEESESETETEEEPELKSSEDEESEEESENSETGSSDLNQEESSDEDSESEGEDITNIIDVEEVKKPKLIKLHPDAYRGAAISKYDPDPVRAEYLQARYPKQLIIHRLDNQNDSVPTISGNRGRISSLSGCRINSGRLAIAARNNVRVFNRRRGEGGGVILIDNSGSMSIPESTLINFAANLPLATIAFYSAKDDSDKTKQGHLSIYAANGRRAGKFGTEVCGGYGNLVDYQAINWLMEQPGPRWYVGDQSFTGSWCYHCVRFFNSLVSRKLVTPVRTLTEMTEILESQR